MDDKKNEAKLFVGIKGKRISWDTLGVSAEKVWDNIFYRVEHAQAQFNREQAPRMLGQQGWKIVEATISLPPGFQILEDGETVR